MALKTDIRGMRHTYPDYFEVGLEKIREFAMAIKADDPASLSDEAAALIPKLTIGGIGGGEDVKIEAETADLFAGKAALRVAASQRFSPDVMGWDFPIGSSRWQAQASPSAALAMIDSRRSRAGSARTLNAAARSGLAPTWRRSSNRTAAPAV